MLFLYVTLITYEKIDIYYDLYIKIWRSTMKYFILILLALSLFSMDDMELVELAYNAGLKPVPSISKEFKNSRIVLGEKLFFDKNLSLDRDINCASCHSDDKGGADGRPTAIGHKKRENPSHLNTPTILNTTFSKKFFWDGRSDSLQDQAKGPLQASFEMSITPELAEMRISQNREYEAMFLDSFGSSEVTFEKIANAIATYEKTLVTRGRYDDFLLGYFEALSSQEKEGLELFITKGCVGCHNNIGLGGQVLRKFPLSYHSVWSMQKPTEIKQVREEYSDFLKSLDDEEFSGVDRVSHLYSQMGIDNVNLLREGFFSKIDVNDVLEVMSSSACNTCHEKEDNSIKKELLQELAFPFQNIGGFLGDKNQRGYFRVPLLRNVVRTAPYFHNGNIEKLEDAIRIMGRHQGRIALSKEEIAKIVTFLKAVNAKKLEASKITVETTIALLYLDNQ